MTPSTNGERALTSFTTIKVREDVRRWVKAEAARNGVPMYVMIERLLTKAARGKPWKSAT